MEKNTGKKDPRSTRLVCAKLYEGGLLSSYEILNAIKRKPFKGKSPEFELDIDKITQHAEAAFTYHIQYALLAILLSFLAVVSNIYNSQLSSVFSILTICLLSLKPVWDRSIALEHFSREKYDEKYNLNDSSNGLTGIKAFLKRFSDWLTRNKIELEKDEVKPQNVVIFGDYFPFLGAGKRTRNWNFVTDLSKPKKGLDSLLTSQNNQENENKINEIHIGKLYESVYDRIKKKIFQIFHINLFYSQMGIRKMKSAFY